MGLLCSDIVDCSLWLCSNQSLHLFITMLISLLCFWFWFCLKQSLQLYSVRTWFALPFDSAWNKAWSFLLKWESAYSVLFWVLTLFETKLSTFRYNYNQLLCSDMVSCSLWICLKQSLQLFTTMRISLLCFGPSLRFWFCVWVETWRVHEWWAEKLSGVEPSESEGRQEAQV